MNKLIKLLILLVYLFLVVGCTHIGMSDAEFCEAEPELCEDDLELEFAKIVSD